MKLQRRNCVKFTYKPFLGETDIDENGLHTGDYKPSYGDETEYYGNISAPRGLAQQTLFGIDTRSADASVVLVEKGIAVTQIPDLHPVNLNTFASEIVLPSYERMDEVALLKVAAM